MQQNSTGTMSFAVTAALFEGALVILALCLGWALDRPPLATFHFNASGMSLGLVATLPLLGFFWFCMKSKWRAFVRILHVLDETFIPLFRQCGLIELGVIALLAGLGEEMLFRDIVQGWLADKIGGFYGAAVGLGVAAMIFGLLHCITPAYVLLAGGIGLYFGAIWLATGNLFVPIISHALYDFLALLYLVHFRKSNDVSDAGPTEDGGSEPLE
jgi:membrane protease YdiL (CAAX protease family)